MVRSPAQTSSADAAGVHLVLYDGVCGLCSRLVQFVLEHDRRAVFRFAALQSATGRAMVEGAGGDPRELTSFYVCANYRRPDARVLRRSGAVLFVAGELGWPWTLMRGLAVLPTALLDRVYDVVARTRYRLFGRLDQCLTPRPEFRGRFIDH